MNGLSLAEFQKQVKKDCDEYERMSGSGVFTKAGKHYPEMAGEFKVDRLSKHMVGRAMDLHFEHRPKMLTLEDLKKIEREFPMKAAIGQRFYGLDDEAKKAMKAEAERLRMLRDIQLRKLQRQQEGMMKKVVVIAKDGKASVGNDIISIVGTAKLSMVTDIIDDFVSYMKTVKDMVLFFTNEKIVAYPAKPEYGDDEVAVCHIRASAPLQLLMKFINNNSSPEALEEMLFSMRDMCDANARQLYDQVRNLSITKVTKCERSKDNRGNFSYIVTRKDGEKDQVEPVKKVTFNVPLFKGNRVNGISVNLDVRMDYRETDSGVTISFSLTNLFIDDDLQTARKATITKLLETTGLPMYWGVGHVDSSTDEWKYKVNAIAD